jgi:hypothetical protein
MESCKPIRRLRDKKKIQQNRDVSFENPLKIPPGAGVTVYCECFVFSGTGLCGTPIPHLEECDQMQQ